MGCLTDCTAGIAKYILFLFNLLILIASIILIVFAVKNKANNGGVEVMSVSSFTIAVAVLIALVAFFGCCGAVKENSCMLTTYAAILITLFIIQVVLGVIAFVGVRNGGEELKKQISEHVNHLYQNKSSDNQQVIDDIQKGLECCGRTGPSDPLASNTNGVLMSSCCKEGAASPCTTANSYQTGCIDKLEEFISSNIKTIGGVAIAFSVIELVAALFACYVKKTSKY